MRSFIYSSFALNRPEAVCSYCLFMALPPVGNAATSTPQAGTGETRIAGDQPPLSTCNLIGKRAVVVGAGRRGATKVEMLLHTGAQVTVIDPSPSLRVIALADQGRLRLKRRKANPADVVTATLVVAATSQSSTNRRVSRWAKPFGAVVNIVEHEPTLDGAKAPRRGLILAGLGRHGRGLTDIRPRFTCL